MPDHPPTIFASSKDQIAMGYSLLMGMVIMGAILLIALVLTSGGRTPQGYTSRKSRLEPVAGVGSQQEAPPIVMKSDAGSNPDLLVPGAQAYQRLATEVFQEDLETITNRRMFEETKRPLPEPLAWDQFRWTGNYNPSDADPYLASPMYRKSLNIGANDGQSLWSHNGLMEKSPTI